MNMLGLRERMAVAQHTELGSSRANGRARSSLFSISWAKLPKWVGRPFSSSKSASILPALACRYWPSGTWEFSVCQLQGRSHLVCEKDMCGDDLRDEMTLAQSHWRPCSSVLAKSLMMPLPSSDTEDCPLFTVPTVETQGGPSVSASQPHPV
jgi:hypothetical protein